MQSENGQQVGGYKPTERQRIILELITDNPSLSAKAISEKISEKIAVTDRTFESDLATLKKNGVIRHFGSRKDGHWEINAPKKE